MAIGCTPSGPRSSIKCGPRSLAPHRGGYSDFFVEREAGQEPAVGFGGHGHAGRTQVAADHVEFGQLAAVDPLGPQHAFFAFAQHRVQQRPKIDSASGILPVRSNS